jgi:type II secretory pathway pseudopilin PulG
LLIVVAIVGIVAAIAAPGLLRARMAGNEASAIASLHAINNAQRAFAVSCGAGHYAPTFEALGAPAVPGTGGFISPDLALPTPVYKSGYEIAMAGEPPSRVPDRDACSHDHGGPAAADLLFGYFATATAENQASGSRDFWTNTAGTLFEKPRAGGFASTNVMGEPMSDVTATALQTPRDSQPTAGGVPPPAGGR